MKKYLVLLKRLLNILFFRRTWSIGYRFVNSETFSFTEKRQYSVIESNLRWWYADPFCIKKDDKYYIFCEMLDSFSGYGSIGVFEYSNGLLSRIRQVLKEPFHLSYPNVFFYKDNYYMIPETAESNQIRLYKATEFPYKWELDTVLLTGLKIVDSTILTVGSKKYLFTYDLTDKASKLRIYYFDIDNKKLQKMDHNILIDIDKQMRSAGNFIYCDDNAIIRPSQYNKEHYGDKIVFNRVEKMPDKGYSETTVADISLSHILTSSKRKFTRIHTINRDGDMEVVDLFDIKLCLVKPFFLLIKMIRKLTTIIKSGAMNEENITG